MELFAGEYDVIVIGGHAGCELLWRHREWDSAQPCLPPTWIILLCWHATLPLGDI